MRNPANKKRPNAGIRGVDGHAQPLASGKQNPSFPGKRPSIPPEAIPSSSVRNRSRQIIDGYGIEVIVLKATYVANPGGRRALIRNGPGTCTVEEYAARHFEDLGYRTAMLENKPLHVLFGTYMWSVIQDPRDRGSRIVGFPDAQAHEAGTPKLIWSCLPRDFGHAEYAIRRSSQIETHLAGIAADRQALRRLFDQELAPSLALRSYLGAHRAAHIEAARELIELLPAPTVIEVLRYLTEHYWKHYAGWPDLLVYREKEFMLVEVKSAADQLGANQQRWIRDNHQRLHLPFRLIEVAKDANSASKIFKPGSEAASGRDRHDPRPNQGA
jgi:hypothetical protein